MHVRRLSLLAGAMTLAASVAQAQTQVPPPQTPVTPGAPVAAPAAEDWIGIYAGGNLGGLSTSFGGPVTFASFVDSNKVTHAAESVAIGPTGPLSSGSGTIGFQVGYAGRLTRTLIGALEFQMTKASPTVDVTVGTQAAALTNFTAADTLEMKAGAMKSLRARVGATMSPDLLVYGTLGVAFSSVHAIGGFPANGTLPAVLGTDTHTMKGLTIGAGAEYAPFKYGTLRALSVGAEFRHASLGTVPFTFATVPVSPVPTTMPAIGTIKVSVNEFDVRVNLRFGAIK